MAAADFSEVTELAGTEISGEQLERMSHRYAWAQEYCRGKDVVEAACGSGQGLGILGQVAHSLEAGDWSEEILSGARAHYGSRVRLRRFDAQAMPFADASKDVVVLFEAIYYLPQVDRFIAECRRVLRPGGCVLIATANKDLADFNPSPMSHDYYGTLELADLFRRAGFEVELFGHLAAGDVSWRQRVLRPVKRMAVSLGLMPRTMRGKRLLKRLVFGRMLSMPSELPPPNGHFVPPQRLDTAAVDRTHKVLYCRATIVS